MEGAWIYNWIQVLRHQSFSVAITASLVTIASIWGLTLISAEFLPALSLAVIALLAMSLVSIQLLDSLKSAIFILGVTSLLLLFLIGLGQFLTPVFNETLVFGWVVILIMLMSNLTHIMTTLLREMARGMHQYDAIAEAVRINSSPILLSNTTTLIGFLLVAWFDAQFMDLALTVLLGWLLIALVLWCFLPYILMNWLLEFRVGHYQDRHGFLFVADFLQNKKWLAKALTALLIGLTLLTFIFVLSDFRYFNAIFFMLATSGFILLGVWQNVVLTLAVLAVSALAVFWAVGFFVWGLGQDISVLLVGLVIPLGIVLDDAIHFFSRIRRAKQGFYRDNLSAIRFTLSSIGRAIWNTSVLLLVGLGVLILGPNMMISQLSLLTLISVLMATFIVLVLLPALYISKSL